MREIFTGHRGKHKVTGKITLVKWNISYNTACPYVSGMPCVFVW